MNELIERIFEDFKVNGIGVPVSFLTYTGDATTYVVYQSVDMNNSISGDDELIGYVLYYDFDIYCYKDGLFRGDYYDIINEMKQLLKEHGFVWQPSQSSPDMFETDTGYYHKTLNFAIYKEEEN